MLTTREMKAMLRDVQRARKNIQREWPQSTAMAQGLLESVEQRLRDAMPEEVTAEPVEPEPREPDEHVAKVTALVRQQA